MIYPFKYPEVYAELARQGKTKKELANAIGVTLAGLRYKQSKNTQGDFGGEEIKAISDFLECPAEILFAFDQRFT